MAKVKISEELKSIRLSNGDNLRSMATKLNVTSAFLSAIENGKKNMPESLIYKMKEVYGLDGEIVEQLKTSAMESQKIISLNLSNKNSSQRELAVCFARQFDDIDEETNKRIMEILARRRKGNAERVGS